eukprot:g11629.t1
MVMLLQKLPKLLVRQAMMIALADVMPQLVESEALRHQVQEMQQRQLSSTTSYLQELCAARSRLRKASTETGKAAATADETKAATDSGRGPANASPERRSSLLKKQRTGRADAPTLSLRSRGTSLSIPDDKAFTEVMETKTEDDEDELPQPSASIQSSASIRSSASLSRHRKNRKSTVAGAAAAAIAFRKTSAQAAVPDAAEERGPR